MSLKSGTAKACVDIGATKTFVALVDKNLRITQISEFPTYTNHKKLFAILEAKLRELSKHSDVLNIAIAARIDADGSVSKWVDPPLRGISFKNKFAKLYKHINIENDGNCFAMKELMHGSMRGIRNGIVIGWGTGIGGALIADGKIYKGLGFASEIGLIRVFGKDKETIEDLIAGKGTVKYYGQTGKALHEKAMLNEEHAISAFKEIGKIFGTYIVSLLMLFDPEVIVIGGSFVNSWKYIKDEVNKIIKRDSIRGKAKIIIDKDKYYVIRGCYLLDEYNKLLARRTH
jgi:glucokinase